MTAAHPIATMTYLRTASLTPGDTLIAKGLGQDSDLTRNIQQYEWSSDRDGVLGATKDLSYAGNQLSEGVHRLSLRVQDTEGQWSTPVSTDSLVTPPVAPSWTMLLYLAGDYHDNNSQINAFNEVIQQLRTTFANPTVRIAVQIDGPADGDTLRLLIRPGSGSTLPQVDVLSVNEIAMDIVPALADFIRWGQDKFPATNYYLVVADHGQAIQGIAWDHTSDQNGAAYLSAKELGQALNDPEIDQIDVLHLDACSMDMLEVAYEARQKANIMIASQYLGWNYFAYDVYQSFMGSTTTPRTVARNIARTYADRARSEGVPFTIAALDLRRSEPMLTAVDNLAAELTALVTNDANNFALH
jgi:hypothetical protein